MMGWEFLAGFLGLTLMGGGGLFLLFVMGEMVRLRFRRGENPWDEDP